MKFINAIIRLIDKLINIVVTLFLLFILFIGVYAIYDYYYITKSTEISKEIINLQDDDEEENDTISLEKLKQINQDIIGWIKLDDTNVDYPILLGKTNNEYLSTDYNKKYSVSGSIFMDYRNRADFSSNYTIIYGHNMSSGKMFGNLKKYADKDYFNKHTKGTIYADKEYELDIIGYTTKSAYDKLYDFQMSKDEIYRYFKEDAKIFIDKSIATTDRLIILSTCDSINRNDRNLLLVRFAEKVIEEPEINIENETGTSDKTNPTSNSNSDSNLILIIIIAALLILILLLIFLLIKKIINNKTEEIEIKDYKNQEQDIETL